MPNRTNVDIFVQVKDLATAAMRRIAGRGVAAFKALGQTMLNVARLAAKAALAIGAIGVAVAAIGFRFLKKGAEQLDLIAKTAARVGVSTESLQKFNFIAGLASISVQETAAALAFFNRNLEEAKRGTERQADAFAKLGVDVQNLVGNETDLVALFIQLSDGFAKLETASERVAVSQDIFGRSGAKLVGILKQSSEAIREQAAELNRLRPALSAPQLKQASEDFIDAFFRFETAIGGVRDALQLELLPTLSREFTAMARVIADNRKEIVDQLTQLADAFKTFALLVAQVGLFVLGVFNKAMKGLELIIARASTEAAKANLKLAETLDLPTEVIEKRAKAVQEAAKKEAAAFSAASEADVFQFVKTFDEIRKQLDALLGEGGGAGTGPRKPDRFVSAFGKIKAGLEDGLREFSTRVNDLVNIAREAIVDVLTSFESGFTDAFSSIILGTKSLADAFKDMAKAILEDLARIIARLIAMRLLAAPLGLFGFGGGSSAPSGAGAGVGGGGPETLGSNFGGGFPGGGGGLSGGLGVGGGGTTIVNINAIDAKSFEDRLRGGLPGAIDRDTGVKRAIQGALR